MIVMHSPSSTEVSWDRLVSFQGRNGTGKCSGVSVFVNTVHGQIIDLAPLTSRRNVANCSIEVPFEALHELVDVLTRLRDTFAPPPPKDPPAIVASSTQE